MATAAKTETETLSWTIGGMDCAGSAAKIRGAIERLPGVSDVRLSVMSETLTLSLDENRTRRDAIEKHVVSLGYTAMPASAPRTAAPEPAANCGCGHDHGPTDKAQACGGHEHVHDHDRDHPRLAHGLLDPADAVVTDVDGRPPRRR